VNLLYVCDFPPSNLGGGPILMSRLLREYPSDSIAVLTSDRFRRISPSEGRLACDEVTVALSEGYGRFGLGRLRIALNWLRVPFITMKAIGLIRRRKISAVVTVLHGYFYLSAVLASRFSGVPYVVIVHDDYASGRNLVMRRLTGFILRHAAHVYCVSAGMQEMIRSEFSVESELQWPGTDRLELEISREANQELSIVFAGSITAAVEDSLKIMADLMVSGELEKCGISGAKLHLYSVVREDQRRAWGWDHPNIVIHSWINQSELVRVLRISDILFLPFSFAPSQRHTVQTAFPSKTADYLASGTPTLVFGPEYSSLVAYARREAFAEIVSDPNPQALAAAIRRIALDPQHRQTLSLRSLQTFSKYHDIRRQRTEFMQKVSRIAGAKSTAVPSRI
jgi:glycosyltransferase involved in cell wall biosynthesis